jgi:hypothetical protein
MSFGLLDYRRRIETTTALLGKTPGIIQTPGAVVQI